jgi:predicted aspartyl protease
MSATLALAAALSRFVIMRERVEAYGVPGTGTIVVDRRTGHFVRRFAAGPASEQEGWDGSRAWRADATGTSRVQANSGERAEIVGWSSALVHAINSSPHHTQVAGATDHVDIYFDRYQNIAALSLPARIAAKSEQNGVWTADLQSAQTMANVAANAFAPPAHPADAHLDGVSRIPIAMTIGSPVIEVRVNGTRLHFALDTGGQNVITPHAAQLAGLRAVGGGVVSGGGGGTTGIRYAFADSVRVGGAEMRHQPFIVIPAESLPPVDGIVGYELLSRFAARLDMEHQTLELAPQATAFGPAVAPARFGYFDRQPQVEGSLDGVHGAFSIDTGSSLTAQIQTPIVRSYRLIHQLHATVATHASDVGGSYPIYLARARAIRLGQAQFPRPLVDLLVRSATSNDSTIVANVGDGILRRWVLVFDYPHQTIDFRPGGDPSGIVVHDRSGIVLSSKSSSLVAALVFSGTPASHAGIREGAEIVAVNGDPVASGDLVRVRALLRGRPGTKIRLQLGDGSDHEFTLRQYL